MCHFFVLTTFWRHLWSITEQMHGNMESLRIEQDLGTDFSHRLLWRVNRSSVKANTSRTDWKEMWCIKALSTNILSIVLKYVVACLVVDKPVSRQHVLKKQNVFCNLERCFDVSLLSAFEVRSIKAAKSKSSSCLRKKTLSWVVAHLPSIASIKVWKVRTVFRVIKFCLVWSAMFTRARGVKNLPSMHCDYVLRTSRELATFIST